MQGQPLLCHDLKVFDDPDIGFMREITAHREEELALGIMPDVITYVICGNVSIYVIGINNHNTMLPVSVVIDIGKHFSLSRAHFTLAYTGLMGLTSTQR